jgi:HlyD family secretion protein
MEVALMRRTTCRLAVAATIALGVAIWTFNPAREVQVTTARVTSGPIIRRVIAAGTLQAETTVEVGAEVSGVVQSLAADYNSSWCFFSGYRCPCG